MWPGLVLTVILAVTSVGGYAQPTHKNERHTQYLKKYDILCEKLEDRIGELNALAKESPYLVDSIRSCFRQAIADMNTNAFRILLDYADEEWSAEEFCALMFDLPNEDVRKFYELLPPEAAESPYGADIKRFLELGRIEVGDRYFDFEAEYPDGARFTLSDIVDKKDVLLILDGLYCMGDEGVNFLKGIYAGIDHEKIEFVSVSLSDDREEWMNDVEHFGLEWIFVSDLKGEHSDIALAYAVRATPTCAYIQKGGEVEIICSGLSFKLQRKLKSAVNPEAR